MGTRILTFHRQDPVGNETRIGPTYYMEADYAPVAVRIYAVDAPLVDAQIDIFNDGVSIFNNRTPLDVNLTTGLHQTGAAVTAAVLAAGTNLEENAEDFTEEIIEEGSVVYCTLLAGSGQNFSVSLEIEKIDD